MNTIIRKIWLGPLLGKQRDKLIKLCREQISAGCGNQILYIAASRPLMLEVYDQIIDGVQIQGNFGYLPIHLFNGLIHQILQNTYLSSSKDKIASRERIDLDHRPMQNPLIAQIMKRLAADEQIKYFGNLASSDGCIASVAELIGEIQRAGKSSMDFHRIVEERINKIYTSLPSPENLLNEIQVRTPEEIYGYERDIDLIYQCYQTALAVNDLTEINEDQLRIIEILSGTYQGLPCYVPYLEPINLLILDGFFDFTPAQGEILRRLIRKIPKVIFNFDYELYNRGVFDPIEDTLQKIEKMDENFQRVIFSDIYPCENNIETQKVAPELQNLRWNLFNTKISSTNNLEPLEKSIFIYESPDRERELRAIAKEIKKLVFADNYKPHEIAVVIREKGSYSSDLRRIFKDEAIEYSLNERMPISNVPAIKAVRKLLDAASSRHNKDKRGIIPRVPVSKLIGVLQTDYFSITTLLKTPDAINLTTNEIENVVVYVGKQLDLNDWLDRAAKLLGESNNPKNWKISNQQLELFELDSLQELTNQDELTEESEAFKKQISHTRVDAVTHNQIVLVGKILFNLGQLLLKIPYEAEVTELIKSFEQVLDELHLNSGLEQVIKLSQNDPEKMLRATIDLRGLQSLFHSLRAVQDAVYCAKNGIETTFNSSTQNTRIKISDLKDMLSRSLSSQQLRIQPETFGAIPILEVTDIRGLSFRAIFILGLVEGTFPMRGYSDWIYPAREREHLKEYGLTLEDISPAVMRKEEHYFYQVACRATEKLYLTWPRTTADDADTVKSYFITEVERIFSPEKFQEGSENFIKLSKGYDGSQILEATTKLELVRSSTSIRRRARRNESIDLLLPSFENLSSNQILQVLERHVIEKEFLKSSTQLKLENEVYRYSNIYGPFDGKLLDESVQKHVASYFGPQHTFSATEFNEYGQCPFRFFANRVLFLKTPVEAALDLQNQDRGLLLHEVLKNLFDLETGKSILLSDKNELLLSLKQTAQQVFDKFEKRIPPLNPKLWEIEKKGMIMQLEQVLEYEFEIKESNKIEMHPLYAELAFGMSPLDRDPSSVNQPLVLKNDEGETIRLRGQIDRIDISSDGKLIAYDYKTFNSPSLTDIKAGRDLQLTIYFEAIDQLFCQQDQELIGGGYYLLRQGSERRNNGLYRSNYIDYTNISSRVSSNLPDQEWNKIREQSKNFIWEYLQKIRNADFQVKPVQNEITCKYCNYKPICRFDRYRILPKVKTSFTHNNPT